MSGTFNILLFICFPSIFSISVFHADWNWKIIPKLLENPVSKVTCEARCEFQQGFHSKLMQKGQCASGKGTLIGVYEEESEDTLIYWACIDKKRWTTFYVDVKLEGGEEQSVKRPSFDDDCFHSCTDNFYRAFRLDGWQNGDVIDFNKICVSGAYPGGDKLYGRGHLFAMADAKKRHKIPTFYYLNAVPQMHVLNNGNWGKFEEWIRNEARALKEGSATTNNKLRVVTGTYGVLELPRNGKQEEVYLGRDAGGQKIIPVPKYIWKLVFHPDAKCPAAVIQFNHNAFKKGEKPFLCEETECPKWLNKYKPWWAPDGTHKGRDEWRDVTIGYTFCCNSEELRKILGVRELSIKEKKVKKCPKKSLKTTKAPITERVTATERVTVTKSN